MDTRSRGYADRLSRLQSARWKTVVPNPYRWWLRRLQLGTVLDVGCGLGRSLTYLDGNGVGVDHNEVFVEACRAKGLTAFTPDEFAKSSYSRQGSFDALIMLHVLEHLDADAAESLLRTYVPYVRDGGAVVLVTPQERGYASDPTHVRFVHGDDLLRVARTMGLSADRWRSFPFPRWAGTLWIYNEFSVIARVPTGRATGAVTGS